MDTVKRFGHRALRRFPRRFRNLLIRYSSPRFSVAAIVLISDDEGRYVMVRPTYREWWGFPGGMVGKGEMPDECARRETREEVGREVELIGEPIVIVDAHWNRVEFAWRGRLLGDGAELHPGGPEIAEAAWVRPVELGPRGLHGQWMIDDVEAAWTSGQRVIAAPSLKDAERGLSRR